MKDLKFIFILAIIVSVFVNLFALVFGDWTSIGSWGLFALIDTAINLVIAYPLGKILF